MRSWLLACAVLLLAGCASPSPEEAESVPSPAAPVTEPFRFDGDLGLVVCVPSGSGCGGPALPSGDDAVRLKAGLSEVDLELSWQATTPASLVLSMSIFCPDLPEATCPGGPLRVEGQSPLVLQGPVGVPLGSYATLVVHTANPTAAAGMFMQVHDTTVFTITGTLTFGLPA